MLFECEFPEAAAVLMSMCRDNMRARQHGKRNQSFSLDAVEQAVSSRIGRNDACPCGSGKKYKKCCGS